jgi:hypothetical protein
MIALFREIIALAKQKKWKLVDCKMRETWPASQESRDRLINALFRLKKSR